MVWYYKGTYSITNVGSSWIIIDGQATVNARGKPSVAKTFGELPDIFVKSVHQAGYYDRIDVIFIAADN